MGGVSERYLNVLDNLLKMGGHEIDGIGKAMAVGILVVGRWREANLVDDVVDGFAGKGESLDHGLPNFGDASAKEQAVIDNQAIANDEARRRGNAQLANGGCA